MTVTLSLNHDIAGSGVPVAPQSRVAVDSGADMVLDGWVVICGDEPSSVK